MIIDDISFYYMNNGVLHYIHYFPYFHLWRYDKVLYQISGMNAQDQIIFSRQFFVACFLQNTAASRVILEVSDHDLLKFLKRKQEYLCIVW